MNHMQNKKAMSDSAQNSNDIDILADVLDTLRFRGSVFFLSSLAAPWGMSLASEGTPRFHIVFSGQCFVGANYFAPREVNANDIVVLADGGEHWIADKPGRELIQSTTASQACQLGNPLFQQGDITHKIMCGLVHFDHSISHPFLDSLPDILHFENLSRNGAVWATIELIDAEINRMKRHTGRIIDRLTEVLFIQLLEQYGHENKDTSGFLGALHDRRIYNALALIHKQPARAWTLDALGDAVGMSRSTLVRHFQDSVGIAPMAYITQWRLSKIYQELRCSSKPLGQIAKNYGFASTSTMNKAFHRCHGFTPTQLRKSTSGMVS